MFWIILIIVFVITIISFAIIFAAIVGFTLGSPKITKQIEDAKLKQEIIMEERKEKIRKEMKNENNKN